MTALSGPRNTIRLEEGDRDYGLAAGAKIHQGGLVCLNAQGFAVPGTTALNLITVGRAERSSDNSEGAAGAKSVRVKPGSFRWANSAAADLITIADRGRTAFVVDDQTVARTDGGGTRSSAGVIVEVDAQGVFIRSGIGI